MNNKANKSCFIFIQESYYELLGCPLGGNVGHEVATANETEDADAVVLVQDTQRAQHLA